ncbi:DUF4410 domain-containing protein [Roseomonas eburnea]|uniref:DUF4410 domain-containing protein n=1 Tax=Neoroseomonas eburnea TaxID=1346889 RepID=A0A9X9XDB9_9PROT|nr:DUF4410 domain-containing protein [Neoroseomonas eburnea]MBR0681705.1 DUF4410 domain-containing protein [Neoroseomonas eburnea]
MTAATHALAAKTEAGAGRRECFAPILVLLLLTGCGGARLTETATAAHQAGPPPARLLVVTEAAQAATEGADPLLAGRTATQLTAAIVQGLQERGIPAETATVDRAGPDAARLSLRLLRVEEGSRLQRIALGFGLGQSRLEVQARLLPPGGQAASQDLLFLHGSSHSGYRPGLVMPLGVGLGTRSVLAVAGAAGTAAAEFRGRGPSRDLRDLAEAVVERTVTYFRQVGWDRQAEPLSVPAVGGPAIAGPGDVTPRRG